jgi:hypothetical protein
MNPPLLQNQEVLFQLPFAAKLEVEFRDHQLLKSYVSDQLTVEQRIPVGVFPGGRVELQIRYQNETGLWGTFMCNLDLPERPTQPVPQYSISTQTPITNQRRILLNLAMVGGMADDTKVSYGEDGIMSEWLPFQPVVDYVLSAGDGRKNIVVRFQDRAGNIQAANFDVDLDTLAPNITLLENSVVDPKTMQIKWSSSEAAISWLRILTDQGIWSEIPVNADTKSIFTGDIPLPSIIFCQIVLKDQAGNVKITDNEALNAQISSVAPYAFLINDGKKTTNSRWVQIKPAGVAANTTWAVSNDLKTWSAWQQGDVAMKWRLNPGDHEQLVYIKNQITGMTKTSFQVIPVVINTIAPMNAHP